VLEVADVQLQQALPLPPPQEEDDDGEVLEVENGQLQQEPPPELVELPPHKEPTVAFNPGDEEEEDAES